MILLLVGSVGSVQAGEESGVKTELESALASAISAAKRCRTNVEKTDVKISVADGVYKIEFINIGMRGGGALVIVDRTSARVMGTSCLQ